MSSESKRISIFVADDFDVVVTEISSLSIETAWTNNGLTYQIEVKTKAGKSFMWPDNPPHTKEEAIKLKTKLRNAIFINNPDIITADSV